MDSRVGDAESGAKPRRGTSVVGLLLLSLFMVPPLRSVCAGLREREQAGLNAKASSRAMERLQAAQRAWEENNRRFPKVEEEPYRDLEGTLPPTSPDR